MQLLNHGRRAFYALQSPSGIDIYLINTRDTSFNNRQKHIAARENRKLFFAVDEQTRLVACAYTSEVNISLVRLLNHLPDAFILYRAVLSCKCTLWTGILPHYNSAGHPMSLQSGIKTDLLEYRGSVSSPEAKRFVF